MDEKTKALKKYFGFDSFHPGQEILIDALLAGQDVLGIMPTGAGKSICYQIPAILFHGITLVVSPLLSLMKDQVRALNAAGVPSAYINSSLTEGQIRKALLFASQGKYRIIYVAPERLTSAGFLRFALDADISLLAVDEAHCISQWGQDFRPSYLKIAEFASQLKTRPVIGAFTATATEQVKNDIAASLRLRTPQILVTGFDRKNLFFSVQRPRNKDQWILDYLSRHRDESGILYCATRKNTEKLYELLNRNGFPTVRYHAGMTSQERVESQDQFIFDRVPRVAATNAFGMGIDKSNVRYVIHYNMPQSMENYYQEAGRAGRDGEESECILLFSPQDIIIGRYMIDAREQNGEMTEEAFEALKRRDLIKLRQMEKYCTQEGCLRQSILKYFGEDAPDHCGHCSWCTGSQPLTDATREAQLACAGVVELNGRFGLITTAKVLTGTLNGEEQRAKFAPRSCYKALEDLSETEARSLLEQMIREEILLRDESGVYPLIKAGPGAAALLEGKRRFLWRKPEETSAHKKTPLADSGADREELLSRLREVRAGLAALRKVPPYIIFSDRTLNDMCVKLPVSRDDFMTVSGVGFRKAEEYGEAFLSAIRSYCLAHSLKTVPGEAAARKPRKTYTLEQRKKFSLTAEEAQRFVPLREPCSSAQLAQALSALKAPPEIKKLYGTDLEERLAHAGWWILEGNGMRKRVLPQGARNGLKESARSGKAGTPYTVLEYPPDAQRNVLALYTDGQTDP